MSKPGIKVQPIPKFPKDIPDASNLVFELEEMIQSQTPSHLPLQFLLSTVVKYQQMRVAVLGLRETNKAIESMSKEIKEALELMGQPLITVPDLVTFTENNLAETWGMKEDEA